MGERGSFRIARIAGIELRLHYSWIIIAVLITFSLGAHFSMMFWPRPTVWAAAIITGLLFFVTLIAHEMSHAMVAKSRGLPIRRITLFLLGGVAQIEREAQDAATEFWMAIAGPAMSVAIGLGCLGVAVLAGWQFGSVPLFPVTAVLVWLGLINLVLAAFNMIPGFPMDGGRVLRALIWWRTKSEQKATRIAANVGQAVGWLFIAWGVWNLFTGRGIGSLWIALIGWFLIQSAGSTLERTQIESALKGLFVEDVMSGNFGIIESSTTVRDFADNFLLRSPRRSYAIHDHDRLVGMVTPLEVRSLPQDRWNQATVADIMIPVRRLVYVELRTPLFRALEQMGKSGNSQLPVVEDGRLVGTVSQGDIAEVVRNRSELRVA